MSSGRDDRDELLERYLEIRDPFLPPETPLLEAELHAQTEDLRPRTTAEQMIVVPASEWHRLCDIASNAARLELELRRVRVLLSEVMRALR